MRKLHRGIIAALMTLPVILYGGQEKELDYEFNQDRNSYSFRGSFIVNAELDCLIDVIFRFEHISKYASGAKSIELVQQGENWHEVTYTYRKLIIFENKSTWRRTLKRDERRVVFEMLSNKSNIGIMPKALSSAGYYQIKPEKEGYRLEYYQECELKPGILRNTYIKKARKEAIRFLLEFRDYVERTCTKSDF